MIPKNWHKQAHQLWEKNDKQAAINILLTEINRYGTQKPRDLTLQFSYYLFLLGDYGTAADVLKLAHEQQTDDNEILQNLVAVLSRGGFYDDALIYAQRLQAQDPNNFLNYDGLSKIYAHLERFEEAKDAGTQSLIIKDQIFGQTPTDWQLPNLDIKNDIQDKKKVISFSLFGNQPSYLKGALLNLLLAPRIYPDWQVYFWLDDTVPHEFQEIITQLGGIIKKQPNNQPILQRLSWRFLVSDDKDIGYFLVRDVDSVVNIREAMAVNEWIKSGKYFHIMRDWWTHTDLILAGMWGGIAGLLPNMQQALSNYRSQAVETPNIDQWFLRDHVWKYAKTSLYIHDRCFRFMAPYSWPNALPPNGTSHVGMDETVQLSPYLSILLQDWVKKYSCLQ